MFAFRFGDYDHHIPLQMNFHFNPFPTAGRDLDELHWKFFQVRWKMISPGSPANMLV